MNLKVYLATKNMTVTEFCKKIECNRCYMSRVIQKHTIPSKRFAQAIELVTNGEVTANELLNVEISTGQITISQSEV